MRATVVAERGPVRKVNSSSHETPNPSRGGDEGEKTKPRVDLPRNTERQNNQPEVMIGARVIIDPRGYDVTNQHLVGGGETITVAIDGGTELPAEELFQDWVNDPAVLRVR